MGEGRRGKGGRGKGEEGGNDSSEKKGIIGYMVQKFCTFKSYPHIEQNHHRNPTIFVTKTLGREGKRREEKGREEKGREGGREGKEFCTT